MSAESDLFAVLDASAGLAALVSGRIYPIAIPEKKPLPAIIYLINGEERNVGLDLSNHGTATSFTLQSIAETYTAARAIGDAIEAALLAEGVPVDNRNAGLDEESGAYVDLIELTWWG